jgi:dynein heavy chain, axonemal
MATIPEYKCNPEQPFADIIVPTSDTVRYTYIMRSLLLSGSHVLAVGETGTGKTLAIQVWSSHSSLPPKKNPSFLQVGNFLSPNRVSWCSTQVQRPSC